MPLSAPEPLAGSHITARFSCGVAGLDEWLHRRARGNQVSGASRTYVVHDRLGVVAYYATAAGAISVGAATGRFRRNMPEPIPVALLGRLAVDQKWHGQGIGRALFRDCGRRVLHAADSIGIGGIVVHAISDQAHVFYGSLGFEASALDPMTLMVALADVQAALVRQPD